MKQYFKRHFKLSKGIKKNMHAFIVDFLSLYLQLKIYVISITKYKYKMLCNVNVTQIS